MDHQLRTPLGTTGMGVGFAAGTLKDESADVLVGLSGGVTNTSISLPLIEGLSVLVPPNTTMLPSES